LLYNIGRVAPNNAAEPEPVAEIETEKPEPPEDVIPAKRGRPPRVKMEE